MTYKELEKKISVNFHDKTLLERAFIHRSYINEVPKSGLEHNERLEFLGDAVLELIVTKHLYSFFPEKNEGDLTAYRSALVNAVTLGDVGLSLGFNDLLRLSKGEAKDISKARLSILADAYEAFLGALYLDQGYESAKEFVEKTLLVRMDDMLKQGLYRDSKSFVQEKAQEIYAVTPSYKLIEEMGPDHDKRFVSGIYFGEKQIALGEGRSKQEAEVQAARAALVKKGWQ